MNRGVYLNKAERKREKLRLMLERKEMIVAPMCDSPASALMIDKAGFDCISISGGSTIRRLGMTDVGLITLTESVTNLGYIAKKTNIPVLADLDTGFGSALNAIRAVKDHEAAGASGIKIEDQATPKRCAYAKGKVLISKEEMILKIKACVEARNDPNLVIIARSDARGRLGDPEELRKELYDRSNAYLKAGADIISPMRPENLEDLKRDVMEVKGPIYGQLRLGLSIQEMDKMGIAICAGGTGEFAIQAEWQYLLELKKTGKAPRKLIIDLDKPGLDYREMTGEYQNREWEEKFLPPEDLIHRYGTKEVPRTF